MNTEADLNVQAAAKLFAEWTANKPSTTLCFDSTFQGGVRVEWQTCIAIEVGPADLQGALQALHTLDALGASTI